MNNLTLVDVPADVPCPTTTSARTALSTAWETAVPAMVMATAAVAWTAAVDLLNAIRR